MSITAAIKQEAHALGFDAVGITHVSSDHTQSAAGDQENSPPFNSEAAVPQRLFDRLTEWLRRGYHGTMAWMERAPDKRADPCQVLPGCRSIISLGINYLTDHRANEQPGYGRIARYAWGTPEHEVAPFTDPKVVSIAAVNGPAQTVVSGAAAAVEAICATFAARGLRVQRLTVSHAFHSPLMDPIVDAFERAAREVQFSAPVLPLVSNATGQLADARAIVRPDYWSAHIRGTVRFADGMKTVAAPRGRSRESARHS